MNVNVKADEKNELKLNQIGRTVRNSEKWRSHRETLSEYYDIIVSKIDNFRKARLTIYCRKFSTSWKTIPVKWPTKFLEFWKDIPIISHTKLADFRRAVLVTWHEKFPNVSDTSSLDMSKLPWISEFQTIPKMFYVLLHFQLRNISLHIWVRFISVGSSIVAFEFHLFKKSYEHFFMSKIQGSLSPMLNHFSYLGKIDTYDGILPFVELLSSSNNLIDPYRTVTCRIPLRYFMRLCIIYSSNAVLILRWFSRTQHIFARQFS